LAQPTPAPHQRSRPLLGLALGLLAAPLTLAADGPAGVPAPRGPSEIRDEYLLAQPRLTLPAIAPTTTLAAHWELRLATLWSSTFVWLQDVPGEDPGTRRYLIDGEAFTLDATARRGLTANLDVALRVPLRWRGGGVLDEVIDAWHRLTHLPNNERPDFVRNAFRVEGHASDGTPFTWGDRTGLGLGDLELETRWRFRDGAGRGPSLALAGRISVPTATGTFANQGFGCGGQIVLAAPVARAFDLYAGIGGTAQAARSVSAVRYDPLRAHGFLALEWRAGRRLSFVVETDAASRLASGIADYPALDWLLNVVGRVDLGRRTRLDVGFTENVADQNATTDFAAYLAIGVRP
jgi:hypothetical protein